MSGRCQCVLCLMQVIVGTLNKTERIEMSDDINIVNIGTKDRAVAATEALKRDMPVILQQVLLIAEIRKASYDACIKHGFTEKQALELCKLSI